MQHEGEKTRESTHRMEGMRINTYMKVKFMFDTLVELDRLHKIDARRIVSRRSVGIFRVLKFLSFFFKFIVEQVRIIWCLSYKYTN